MAIEDGNDQPLKNDEERWPTDPLALEFYVQFSDDDQRPTSIVLQHPTVPFRSLLDIDDDAAIHDGAVSYLRSAVKALTEADALNDSVRDLLEAWLEELAPGGDAEGSRFGWVTDSTTERRSGIQCGGGIRLLLHRS